MKYGKILAKEVTYITALEVNDILSTRNLKPLSVLLFALCYSCHMCNSEFMYKCVCLSVFECVQVCNAMGT